MSLIADLIGTGKLLLTLEDRIAAIASRVDRLEHNEVELRERMIRVETTLELLVYGESRRLPRK